jgi:hypothetical protein
MACEICGSGAAMLRRECCLLTQKEQLADPFSDVSGHIYIPHASS